MPFLKRIEIFTAEDCDTVKMPKSSVNAKHLKLSSTKEVIKTLQ